MLKPDAISELPAPVVTFGGELSNIGDIYATSTRRDHKTKDAMVVVMLVRISWGWIFLGFARAPDSDDLRSSRWELRSKKLVPPIYDLDRRKFELKFTILAT